MTLTYTSRPPSPAGRRLAGELRGIRERAGLNGDAAAARMKWSPSKVSRVERGRCGIRPADVEKLLALYKVTGDQAQALQALAVRAWEERDLEESDRFAVSEVLAWAPLGVPRLLRTEDYHAELVSVGGRIMPVSPGMIREEVSRNAMWQARLLGETPMKIRAVLDESVLRRRFGTDEVMRAQIQRLANLAGQDHVDLRVLLHHRVAPTWLPPFTITRYSDGEDDLPVSDEVSTDMLTGAWAPESERDTWLHSLAFDLLAGEADQPGDLLKQALAHWS
jgi:transcriptional regulator with XRE-family HTH domain